MRVGLSMEVMVDVSNKDGRSLANAPRVASITQTEVFGALEEGAHEEVRRVIAANLGYKAMLKAVAKVPVPAAAPVPAG